MIRSLLMFLFMPLSACFLGNEVLAALENETKLIPMQATENDRVGRSVAVSRDGNTLILGAPSGFIGSEGHGAAYVYVRSASGWVEEARLSPSGTSPTDQFGESVGLSGDGDTAVVGSWDAAGGPGALYVFRRVGSTWTEQAKLQPSDTPRRYFGWSASISDDGMVVLTGSPTFGDGGAGAAYVFVDDGGSWQEEQKLVPSGAADATNFGSRATINASGKVAAVSDNSDDAVNIYLRDGAEWSWVQRIADVNLGSAAALDDDGSRLVVGANSVWSGSGYINVYDRIGNSWQLKATLVASAPENGDWFGSAVAISADGNRIAVGANFSDVGTEVDVGAVYAYRRIGSEWSTGEKITSSDPTFNDEFGNAVSLSGDGRTLLVGAHNKDFHEFPTYRGAAYVFKYSSVGGTVTDLALRRVRCLNRTTGQTVEFTTSTKSWDCEARGLVVEAGNRITIWITGVAE